MSAFLLAACGDDESSGFTTRPDEDSSSSVCEDCDDSSSSSSVTPQSSESETSVSSSSSAKSSSSKNGDAKSSSSSAESLSSDASSISFFEDGVTGTMTDGRDGQTYKIVKIGEQIWMAENLNYKTESSYCYRDADSNCTKFGRLYTWAAAMDSAAKWSINGYRCGSGTYCFPSYPVRGVCPEGWHLPRKEEWNALIDVAGGNEEAGKALTSKNGWFEDGTDAFGFSALSSGYRLEDDYHDEPFYSFQTTYNASFWSSTDNSGDAASYMSLNSRNASVESYYRNSAYSVRCLKDDPPHVFPPTVVTGTMTDERDGQTYKTVKIGEQIWMAENLNYAYTGVPYTFGERTWDSTSWCYGNYPVYCAKSKYGRLYTWSAAMDSVGEWSVNGKGCGEGKECSPTYPVRGICPEGWHLPTKAEFETLFAAVGDSSTAGKMLKSTIGWEDDCNGTDDFGFSALPAGDRSNSGLFFRGFEAHFWSSTEGDSSYAYGMNLDYDREYAILDDNPKEYGYSVRCVKD